MEAYNRQSLSEFAELHYEPQELIDANDHVIATCTSTDAEVRAGPRSTSLAWRVFTLRDGRLIRIHAYPDRTRALEAAGYRGSSRTARARHHSLDRVLTTGPVNALPG